MRCLHALCTEALRSLPTSMEADEAELAALRAEQERLRLALAWRIGHKQCDSTDGFLHCL